MSEPVPPAVAAAATKSADARAPLKPCNNKKFHGHCWTKGKNPDRPEAKAKVVEWVKKEYTRDDRGYRLTLWTDAAVHQTNENSTQEGGGPEGENCSSAVVYRNQLNDDEWEWVEETLLHEGIVTIRFGELSAVLLALRKALQIVSSPAGAHITSVAIYSDNLRVVEWIRDYRKGATYWEGWSGQFRAEMAEAVNLTNNIRRIGVQVEIAWIPGHEDLEGNMLADYIARRTAGTLPGWPESDEGWAKLLSGGPEAYEKRKKLVADRERAEQVFAERDEARKNRSSYNYSQNY
ncbi:hypothetical protein DBV05_g5418 [Lasiodiplodia theobromae]|uniref:RNase H type-1 domain-containing protein n=1 Tax=Lasiodiplodia theobromae TaxID=45133 RepID=A0A5N5DE70_9PEZI|nr:hypothetical protein DBV05_g5418 [Lasiodiplodia theobromae]